MIGSQQFSRLARGSQEERAHSCLSAGKHGAAGSKTWGEEALHSEPRDGGA